MLRFIFSLLIGFVFCSSQNVWGINNHFLKICSQPCLPLYSLNKASNTLHISSPYGQFKIHEPVLIELLESPAMKRLKKIRQHGTSDYAFPSRFSYWRFDHSLGVMLLLRQQGLDLKNQIAGLLHDISHTAFSHSTDPLFMKSYKKGAYQDTILNLFLENYGVNTILKKYGLEGKDFDPETFPSVKQPYPHLSADRLEYNLMTGYLDNKWSFTEIKELANHIHFNGQHWYCDNIQTAQKIGECSLFETLTRWSSPETILAGTWTSEIFQHLLDVKKITIKDIQYDKTDDALWEEWKNSQDFYVKERVHWITDIYNTYDLLSHEDNRRSDTILYSKHRGLDPLVKTAQGLQHLSILDEKFRQKDAHVRHVMKKGWPIKFKNSAYITLKLEE